MSVSLFSKPLLQQSAVKGLAAMSVGGMRVAGGAVRHMASVAESETPPRAEAKERIKTFQIYRWNPDTPEKKPTMQEYKVDLNKTVSLCHRKKTL